MRRRHLHMVPPLEDGAAKDGRFVRAPGRVNLIGDHTDYQDGFCLPLAIDRHVTVGFRPRADGRFVLRSNDVPGTVEFRAHDVGNLDAIEPAWGRAAAAVVRVLGERRIQLSGIDAVVGSTIPVGSGLSSSAALEVALALGFAATAGADLSGNQLALAAQRAEHLATGVPCGVMDQMAAVHGRADHALLLDCRNLEIEPIALPGDLDIVVIHSGLPRVLAESDYASRRSACEVAATRLGVPALRDATLEQVADDPLARHVVSENARVLECSEALRASDLRALGAVMLDSHASLARDFGVSTPELDLLVEYLVDAGAFGARLTGAGFGGCVVAVAAGGNGIPIATQAADRYRASTGLEPTTYAVQAVDGASPIDLDADP